MSKDLEARVAELEQRERDTDKAHACQVARVEILLREKAELEARANALRDALQKSRDLLCEDGDWLPGTSRAYECITDALIAHPAASLAAYRKSVLEEAASECETVADENPRGIGGNTLAPHPAALRCAVLIRALAAQAQEVKPS